MTAGQFRHRVNFRQNVAPDGAAAPDFTGKPFAASVPANVVPKSAIEKLRGRQLESEITHVMEMRYLEGIDSTMRVEFRGRHLDISAVTNRDGRQRYMDLDLIEIK